MLNAVKKTRNKIGFLAGVFLAIFAVHELISIFERNFISNTGVSFGQEFPFLLVITGIFAVMCVFLYMRQGRWGLMLVVSGGLVNFSDRLRFNFVRDYWNFFGSGIYNNINDWIISLGVILFLIETIWKKSK